MKKTWIDGPEPFAKNEVKNSPREGNFVSIKVAIKENTKGIFGELVGRLPRRLLFVVLALLLLVLVLVVFGFWGEGGSDVGCGLWYSFLMLIMGDI